MKATTSRHTRIRVNIELEGAEDIESWPGFSHRGKRVLPERMTFEVSRKDGQRDHVGRLTVQGRAYRKDGELGEQRPTLAMFQWHDRREHEDEVLEAVFGPLLAVARSEAQQVLNR